MDRPQLLFVDDEPNIRLTLPAILNMHGYEVTAAGSVPEALSAIHKRKFDILIADLNIGQPGDGFTVVSAMRRTQPKAITIILTGFPAFETALQAIRSQVDDYVVKPARIEQLLHVIDDKLKNHTPHHVVPFKRVGVVLRENKQIIFEQWLSLCKRSPRLGAVKISDKERSDHLPMVFDELTRALDADARSDVSEKAHSAAAIHGRERFQQGFTLTMVLQERSLLRRIVYGTIQHNLLAIDISYVISDMIQISDNLDEQLNTTVEAFLEQAARKRAS